MANQMSELSGNTIHYFLYLVFTRCNRDEHEYSNFQMLKYFGPLINILIQIMTLLIFEDTP